MDYVFMSLVVSTASGIILASLAACRASKCTSVKFCGVQIDRDVEIEEHIEEHKMDLAKKQETNI
jgi:hypothetical protein